MVAPAGESGGLCHAESRARRQDSAKTAPRRCQDGGIYHPLRIGWRRLSSFATDGRLYCVEAADDPRNRCRCCSHCCSALPSRACAARAIGSSPTRLPSFSQLSTGPGATALAAIPLLHRVSAVPDHAQHHSRPPPGRPPLRIRVSGDVDRRLLEPDVGLVLVMTLQACGFLHA